MTRPALEPADGVGGATYVVSPGREVGEVTAKNEKTWNSANTLKDEYEILFMTSFRQKNYTHTQVMQYNYVPPIAVNTISSTINCAAPAPPWICIESRETPVHNDDIGTDTWVQTPTIDNWDGGYNKNT